MACKPQIFCSSQREKDKQTKLASIEQSYCINIILCRLILIGRTNKVSMANSATSNVASLVLRVFTVVLLLISLIIICTTSKKEQSGAVDENGVQIELGFQDFYAYRYVLFLSRPMNKICRVVQNFVLASIQCLLVFAGH